MHLNRFGMRSGMVHGNELTAWFLILAALLVPTGACAGTGGRPATPAAAAATSPAAASAAPSSSGLATVNVTARDYAYDAPETISAGLTRVRMQNAGNEDHQAQLLRLNLGVSVAQVQAALRQGPQAALPLTTAEGGPNVQLPGQTAEAISNIQPGLYVFVCFVPDSSGVPHYAKGMIKALQVTAGSPGPAPLLPPPQTTVTLQDYSFSAPATLPAGQTTITVKNSGGQAHEMSVLKLNGANGDQVKALLSEPNNPRPPGPPPFISEGGIGGISAGATGQTTVTLTPGSYVLVCNIPDPALGKPHVALGMIKAFTVP